MSERRPRVLVLARNYPNPVLPTLGIWTARLMQAASLVAEPEVIAPVPWAPPVPGYFGRFRKVPRRRVTEDGTAVWHPRVPTGPGYLLHRYEAALWRPFVGRLAERLHRERPFDIVHAHFIYPEGVLAAEMGRRWGIPVVSTEQAPWLPWLERHARVGTQVRERIGDIDAVSVVSRYLEDNVRRAVPEVRCTRVVHNVVDVSAFDEAGALSRRRPGELLFVGVVRHVKGLDVLVRAMALLVPTRPAVRLRVVGAAYYRGYQRDLDGVKALIAELGLEDHVEFAGQASPRQVAAAMRRASMLVVPSRSETFSAVTVEALASGTPVVATRCGGPEEILDDALGRLVPVEDPEALAAAIAEVLDRPEAFPPERLRESAVSRFSQDAIAEQLRALYEEVGA